MASVEEEVHGEEVTFKSLVMRTNNYISLYVSFKMKLNNFAFVFQGIVDVLCEACQQLGWKSPTKIQREAIPVALQGKCLVMFQSEYKSQTLVKLNFAVFQLFW